MLQEKDFTKNRYILYARKSSESEDRQVASIASQIDAMQEIAKELKIKIVEVMSESSSGFHVGRNVFNSMVEKIHKGEADGIIVWKLSRLSRNPDDAGRIMGMLQREEIKHIRTVDRNWFPEDNVMMMYVEFGVTNQFSRDLSVDTSRGLLKKAQRGWSPISTLPLGYMHSPYKKLGDEEIIPDPERFEIVKEGLKQVASNRLTPMQSLDFVLEKGLKTRKGKPIGESVWYRILINPFFYGTFEFPQKSGRFYEGKHTQAITQEEYNQIQHQLGRKDSPRPKKWYFPYTGMMKCGVCGCSIIADPKFKHQKNGNEHDYVYYRCTKKRGNCDQRSLEVDDLEIQFTDIISNIRVPDGFHEWAMEELQKDHQKEIVERGESYERAKAKYEEVVKKIDDLVEGYLGKKIPEETYDRKLPEYQKEQNILKGILDSSDLRIKEWINKADEVLDFATKAKYEFEHGDDKKRKEIVSFLGSNLILKDRILSLDLKKPLEVIQSVSGELNVIAEKFEPLNSSNSKEEFKEFLSTNVTWGGIWDEFKNYLINTTSNFVMST